MKISDITGAIEEYAPLWLQEEWDNAGVQVGDTAIEATGALLCVDATEAIVDEAIGRGINLIVSHHPLIFHGLKRITGRTATERIVAKALRHGITIYSAHTNMDSAPDGVSWATGKLVGLTDMRTLMPQQGRLMKLSVFTPTQYCNAVSEALWAAGAGRMGRYDRCAYMTTGCGTYRPLPGAHPAIGTVGESHTEDETRIEVVFPSAICARVVQAMLAAHPYEEPAFDLVPMANRDTSAGLGVVGSLEKPMPAIDYLASVKHALGIGAIRYAGDAGRMVSRVALCGGAGADFIDAAIAAGADLYMCGDLKYHNFTTSAGRIVLADIGHYESEQCTKGIFYEIIRKKFPNFATYYAEEDKNPLSYG